MHLKRRNTRRLYCLFVFSICRPFVCTSIVYFLCSVCTRKECKMGQPTTWVKGAANLEMQELFVHAERRHSPGWNYCHGEITWGSLPHADEFWLFRTGCYCRKNTLLFVNEANVICKSERRDKCTTSCATFRKPPFGIWPFLEGWLAISFMQSDIMEQTSTLTDRNCLSWKQMFSTICISPLTS